MKHQGMPYVRICLLSIAYAVLLLFVTGWVEQWGKWYSPSISLRLQTDALIEHRLSLGNDVNDLLFDYTWTNQSINQVWGLGVPIWRFPFEIMARLLGYDTFPDRLAFGIFSMLVSCILLIALLKVTNIRNVKISMHSATPGIIHVFVIYPIIMLFPTFITLMQTRGYVWEEVIAYGYMFAILEFAALLIFVHNPSRMQLWTICFLSGIGGFIRPTLILYGTATIITAFFVWRNHLNTIICRNGNTCSREILTHKNRHWSHFIIGIFIFIGMISILYETNEQRFGDGKEFGHKLNMQYNVPTLYATKFDYPYQDVGLVDACKELLGVLFLASNKFHLDAYGEAIFPLQSDTARWREMYFRTHDVSHLLFVLTSLCFILYILGSMLICNVRKKYRAAGCEIVKGNKYIMISSIWCITSIGLLFMFYLYVPVISSRYMVDFSAALVISATATTWIVMGAGQSNMRMISVCVSACAWLIMQYGLQDSNRAFSSSIDKTELDTIYKSIDVTNNTSVQNRTQINLDDGPSGIPFDRVGWPTERDYYINEPGELWPLAIIFAKDIQYVELVLETLKHPEIVANPRDIRVKCGLETLRVENITQTDIGWNILFKKPESSRWSTGMQSVFIASTPKRYLRHQTTPWKLRSIRWNDNPRDKHTEYLQSITNAKLPTLANIWNKDTHENYMTLSGLCHLLLFYNIGDTDIPTLTSGEDALSILTDETYATEIFGKSPFVRTRDGVRYHITSDITIGSDIGELHRDQCLSTFATMGLPLDTPIYLIDEELVIKDILNESVARFGLEQEELAWTSIAYAKYLPPKTEWRNRFGEITTFDLLSTHLMDQDLSKHSCAGTHIAGALVQIYNADIKHNVLENQTRIRLEQYIKTIVKDLAERQSDGGSWEWNWCRYIGHGQKTDLAAQMLVTGHILEILNVLEPSLRPRTNVYYNSARWIHHNINTLQDTGVAWLCPYTHAAKAANNVIIVETEQ